VAVALFVVMLVAVLPIPVALQLGGYDLLAIASGQAASLSPQIASGIALYGLVLLGLFLWLGARLILVNPVIVREKKMFAALRQSWRLTRGMTWRIIGVMLLFALVSWVSMLAANMVFGSIFTLVAGGPSDGISLAGVLTSVVVAAVQTGFTVLVPVFSAKLYLALSAEMGLREGLILA